MDIFLLFCNQAAWISMNMDFFIFQMISLKDVLLHKLTDLSFTLIGGTVQYFLLSVGGTLGWSWHWYEYQQMGWAPHTRSGWSTWFVVTSCWCFWCSIWVSYTFRPRSVHKLPGIFIYEYSLSFFGLSCLICFFLSFFGGPSSPDAKLVWRWTFWINKRESFPLTQCLFGISAKKCMCLGSSHSFKVFQYHSLFDGAILLWK